MEFSTKWDCWDENLVEDKLKLTIYRIIQEQLNNVLKHAQAQTVFITLQQQGNEVNLHIQDDGKGFDVTQKRNGVGLKNIKSRAEMFNGRVKIQSEPGKGCVVSVNFSTKNIIATIHKEEKRA